MSTDQFQDIFDLFTGNANDVSPERMAKFNRVLYGMTKKLRNELQEAEINDIVQDVSLKLLVMAKAGVIRKNLLGVAKGLILNAVKPINSQNKKNQPEELNDRISTSPNPIENELTSKESIAELREVIQTLTPEEQEILNKRYVWNLKFVEIANDLGVDDATVRSKHKRILNKLRKQLEKKYV